MLESVFVGIFSSFAASSAFLLVLFKLRPKIEISEEIADQSNQNGPCFAFKLINKSRYQIFDISMEAMLITPVQVPGGAVYNPTELPLRRSHFHELGGFNKKDTTAHYALRVATLVDLREVWKSDSQFLRVNVVSRHALSGFSGVHTMVFHTKGQIKIGKHRFGESLAVEKIG